MFPPRTQDADASIRATDNDAAAARLSAVQKGYFNDPFIKPLVPRAHLQPPRPPLINVGTYVRSSGIDDLVDQWIELSARDGKKCQIVSLGAGSDTRYWRIATGPNASNLGKYIEIDLPEITSKKAMTIKRSKELNAVLGNSVDVTLAQGGAALNAPQYHLLPADLRLPPSETLAPLLTSENNPLLSPSLPTLLLFECVLAYIKPEASSRLLKWFIDHVSNSNTTKIPGILGCVVYEMFGLNDSFGRVMLNNLKSRNVSLPGVEPYKNFESLPNRFLSTGFITAQAVTLRDIRRQYISSDELQRISTLEMLDEVEELELVLQHYAVSWGLFLTDPGASAVWKDWGFKARNNRDQ
ncbi:S-adenosyl-L-methionine-dependent methyltransferase [Cyathus striatus]|nr:S-adenosyl-L-methionine-dependent methyltransferase [Cyathus striatus]